MERATVHTDAGEFTFDFALDTLASWSLMPDRMAAELGIQAHQEVPIETAGGAQMIPLASVMVSFHGGPAMPVPFLLVPSNVLALGQDVIRRYNLLTQNAVIEQPP
jgi:Aspartyl protease